MLFTAPTQSLWLITCLTAITLTACGGGSSTTAASGTDASDKYVGTWKRCNVYNIAQGNFLAFSDVLTIAKVGAASYSSAGSRFDHTDAACTSTGTPVLGEAGTTVFTITGTKTVAPYLVDTLTYPGVPGTTAKDIAYVNLAGPTLQLGSGSAGIDAAGYPNALEGVRFIKL